MAKTADILSLTVERHCILCRLDLPKSVLWRRLGQPLIHENYSAWELDVIGLYDATGKRPDPSHAWADPANLCVFRANLGESLWPSDFSDPHHTILRKDPARGPLHIRYSTLPCQNKTPCSLSDALFFMHACCWQTVSRTWQAGQGGSALPFSLLYRLATQTQSIMPRDCISDEYATSLSMLPNMQPVGDAEDARDAGDATDTGQPSLSAILSLAAAKLPVELQRQIIQYIEGDLGALVLSLLRAQETASTLFGALASPSATSSFGEDFLRVEPDAAAHSGGSRGRLLATHIHIFGLTYLQSVTFVPEEEAGKNEAVYTGGTSVSVRGDVAIAGAMVWIAPLGIQALELVYRDGSKSPRLGFQGRFQKGCFTQEVLFDSPTSVLRACRDDLKIYRIRSDGWDSSDAAEDRSWPSRALWNAGAELPAGGHFRMADTERFPGQLVRYPGRRLCQFLPLQHNGQMATGLTAYCTASGICGMTSHFGGDGIGDSKEQCRIGWRRGMAVHLFLTPGERVVYLAMRVANTTGGRSVTGPILIAGTNRGRSVLFGPQLPSFAVHGTSIFLATSRRPVSGLFTDLLTTHEQCFKSIGFCDAVGDQQLEPSPPIAAAARLDSRIEEVSAFFSSASFTSDIYRMQKRKVGNRCVGLAVYHRGGLVEIMGSWEPHGCADSDAVITDIYHVSEDATAPDDELSTITFRYLPDREICKHPQHSVYCMFVYDIIVGFNPTGPYDVVFAVDEEDYQFMAWWFSESRDVIAPWHPTHGQLATASQQLNKYERKEVWATDSAPVAGH